MHRAIVFLSLGSNLGDRLINLNGAIQSINALDKLSILSCSSVYETEPWGNTNQPNFLNLVLQLETDLSPYPLLETTQKIEQEYGRMRKYKWAERTLDIDILLYNQLILEDPKLTIPHPQMRFRNFVLIPLLEIAPDLEYPGTSETIRQLIQNSPDKCHVKWICKLDLSKF